MGNRTGGEKPAGLLRSKTSLAFHSWTVDIGPLVESNAEI
jgi:hypothetical protein